jgi:aminocarboxymuconate-semialdehyde decarboxylase
MKKESRREFLKNAAIGAAALSVMRASSGFSQSGPTQWKSTIKIDMHSHIEIAEAVDLMPEKPKVLSSPLSPKSAAYQEALTKALNQQLNDPQKKIEDMEKIGVDRSVLSIAPPQFFYHLEGKLALDVFRTQNDRIAAVVQKYPQKFTGMATVPLQNVEAAVAELERAIVQLQLKGVEVGSNVRGRYLGDPVFLPFFEKVKALDVPVFFHPQNVAGADRMRDYYFPNLVGNPLDTTLTAGHLIFSGIFDRLPGLKIALSHAGGHLPYIIGRMGHGFKVRPECQEVIKKSPVEYLSQFYYDTISHGPEALRYLISRVGADRVMLGTDYPYDMGDYTPLASIDAVPGLSMAEKEKIAGRNAASLFKIIV